MNVEHSLKPICYASLRPATEEEKQQARGGILWRCITMPLKFTYCVLGTLELYRNIGNLLNVQEPRFQRLIGRLSSWMGYAHPEDQFMQSIFSFLGNRHLLAGNHVMMKAFFNHYRTGECFINSPSMQKFYEMLQQIFPNEIFIQDDFLMTCSKEYTIVYRSLLYQILKKESLCLFIPTLQATARQFVDNWAARSQQGASINVTEESRLFTSSIITQLMFRENFKSKEIAQAVDFINFYIIKSITKVTQQAEKEQFKRAMQTFREAVEFILQNDDLPLFPSSSSCSEAQKKAMIMMLFFAGQETTSALLTYIIWQLALDSNLQEMIYQEIDKAQRSSSPEKLGQLAIINKLFARSIREFPPVYGVARTLKEDLCLEFGFEGETEIRKCILFKGDIISTRIIEVAENAAVHHSLKYNDWFAFGGGPHRCPGEQLAIQEIYHFLIEILSRYIITTNQIYPIDRIAQVTLKLAEDIHIKLIPR